MVITDILSQDLSYGTIEAEGLLLSHGDDDDALRYFL